MTVEEVFGASKKEKKGLSSGKQGQWRNEEDEVGWRKGRMSRHTNNVPLLPYESMKENRLI
jgi:hypothetical protein